MKILAPRGLGKSSTSSARELAIVDAVGAIYEAAACHERWPDTLDAIARCLGGVGTVLMLRKSDGSMTTIVSPKLEAAARDYEAGGWRLDFLVPRAIEIAIRGARPSYTDRQLATPHEIATHPYFTEFRARHGLGPFVGAFVSPHPGITVILTLQGALGRRPFTAREAQIYARLAHHVERALALTVRIMEVETGQQALADALSRVSCGVAMIDAQKGIRLTNGAMRRLSGGDLVLSDGLLTVTGPARSAFDAACAAALGGMARAVHDGRAMIVTAADETRVALYVFPAPAPPTAAAVDGGSFSGPFALVMAVEQRTRDAPDPALLRDLLGLTLGEAKVAALIGAGRTPRETAAELQVAEDTARSVLKRVFAKVGVSRQSELAALVTRIVVGENT